MSMTALTPLDRTAATFRGDVDNFFISSLPTFVTEANALEANVVAKEAAATVSKNAAAASQVAAALSETNSAASAAAAALSTGVAVWTTATVYAQYVVVVSPIDFQNYRRAISSGVATTFDPANDGTGWRIMNYVKPFVIKTANYSAVNGDRLMLNTSGGAIVILAPSTPAPGWRIQIKDYLNTFHINQITFDGNGQNVEGLTATPMDITTKGWSGVMEFIDATVGWKAI